MKSGGFFMDGLKVLVVDDEARMRKLVKDFLTNKGFQVIEACLLYTSHDTASSFQL